MKFGIFSNGLRGNENVAATYDEDVAEIEAADRFGFDEAWVSEHMGGWLPDPVALADLLIARAAGVTKRIRLGSAVRILPLFHPIDIAVSASICDHLSHGRYMLGIGPGQTFLSNMENRGMTNEQRHGMMMESISFIRKIWSEDKPFDWDGKYWRGVRINTNPRPLQKYPPVAIASGHKELVEMAVREGWIIMSGLVENKSAMSNKFKQFDAISQEMGKTPDRSKLTVARYIHVGPSIKEARDQIRGNVEFAVAEWLARDPKRLDGYLRPEESSKDLTFDLLADRGFVICGDPDHVYQKLCAFYEEVGGFGTLLIGMGKSWGSLEDRTNSMETFMRDVAPRLVKYSQDQRQAA